MIKIFKNKNIYLDHAGATQIDKKVLKKMSKYEKDFFANPSAIYSGGVKAREVIEESRSKIAKLINAHSDEIIFTGSGTESVALALLGLINNYRLLITNENTEYKIPHIITSKIEHPAVLENCKMMEERKMAEVTYISVDKNGIINLEELRDSLKENTILVSIMYANNEIGTIEPIEEVAKIIRHFKKGKSAPQGLASGSLEARPFPAFKNEFVFPIFHTDACQAMNYLFTENIEKLGVDMLTFNSSKIYGPKGIGILYKKRSVELSPLYAGGGQEFGLRPGTENISQIVGLAEAFEITNKIKYKESKRLIKIRNYGIEKLLLLSENSGYKIILNADKEARLPNNINISISDISSELLVIELSAKGIFVSEKSACKSEDENESYVIKAIRETDSSGENNINGSLRISLGRCNKMSDMDVLYKGLKDILIKYKKWK